jgi:hypothetical protein
MTDVVYKAIFQQFQLEDLQIIWQEIKDGTVVNNHQGWEKGKAFEYLIMRAFELGGAEVKYPFSVNSNYPTSSQSPIEQIDGIVYYDFLSCVLECKNLSLPEKVDYGVLAKLRSQLMRRPSATIGSIFSVSGFTEPAIILAGHLAPQTILLWEQTEIDYILETGTICNSLKLKYKNYVEYCKADYNTSVNR